MAVLAVTGSGQGKAGINAACSQHANDDELGARSSAVFVAVDNDLPRINCYGLGQLLRVVGARITIADDKPATIYYGRDVAKGCRAQIWVVPSLSPGNFDWGRDTSTLPALDGNRLPFDVFRATAALLTLEHESANTDRDDHGRVRGVTSPLGIGEAKCNPPVHVYAEWLANLLAKRTGFRAMPRWPHGKRYAVAFTHDVDDPERPRRGIRLLREMITGGRDWRSFYWDLRAELRRNGFRKTFAPAERRSAWDFDAFVECEARCGVRSAFYFASERRSEFHPLDVAYDVRRHRYRRLMHALELRGCEVGLHTGYSTIDRQGSIRRQAERIAEVSGRHPGGVRHHYLRLDPRRPMKTLSEHRSAGLDYDSSVGFNDCPGFRAGVALPYAPFLDTDVGGEFVELPLTIADMHLPRDAVRRATDEVLRHLDDIKRLSGLAILNWHIGHWQGAPAWREAYRAACNFVASDSDAWVALPREIAAWWHRS